MPESDRQAGEGVSQEELHLQVEYRTAFRGCQTDSQKKEFLKENYIYMYCTGQPSEGVR
jgi:hypothetical protein